MGVVGFGRDWLDHGSYDICCSANPLNMEYGWPDADQLHALLALVHRSERSVRGESA